MKVRMSLAFTAELSPRRGRMSRAILELLTAIPWENLTWLDTAPPAPSRADSKIGML